MGIFALILGLVCLAYLCLRGVPVVFASLICSTLVLVLTAVNVFEGLRDVFMPGFAGFVTKYFLIFFFGGLFGKIVEVSGAAETIARVVINKFGEKYVIVGVIVATAVLCYGGVSVFICLFAIYPLAVSLFKKADIPRRLFVGAYMAGGATFAMTAPYTPSVQNIIPTSYLGTHVSACAGPGVIVALFTAVLVTLWMQREVVKAKERGEHFVPHPDDYDLDEDAKRPSFILALIPLITLIVVLNVFKFSLEGSLVTGIAVATICYFASVPKNLEVIWKHVTDSTVGTAGVITSTSATVGFGTVVAASPAFESILPKITSLPLDPLITASVATAVLAGLAGSATGGLAIAIPIVSKIFIPMGVDADALHRVAAVGSSALDTMPHNGATVAFLNYSKTTHKEGYGNVFVCTVIITIMSLILLFILLALFGYM